jgi:hypothetical protein
VSGRGRSRQVGDDVVGRGIRCRAFGRRRGCAPRTRPRHAQPWAPRRWEELIAAATAGGDRFRREAVDGVHFSGKPCGAEAVAFNCRVANVINIASFSANDVTKLSVERCVTNLPAISLSLCSN